VSDFMTPWDCPGCGSQNVARRWCSECGLERPQSEATAPGQQPAAPTASAAWLSPTDPKPHRGRKVFAWVVGVVGGVILAMVVVGAVASRGPSPQERLRRYVDGRDRREYVSAEGRFRATFPGLPQRHVVSEQAADGTELHEIDFVATSGSSAWIVGFLDAPPGLGPRINLEGVGNSLAAKGNGTVEATRIVNVRGLPGVESVIGDAHNVYVKVVALRAGDRIYVVGVTTTGKPPDEAFATLEQSFNLT
jgi:hypothetical protein